MIRRLPIRLIIILSFILCLSLPLPSKAAEDVYSDGILAVVENQVITLSMILRHTFNQEMALRQTSSFQEYPKQVKKLREAALEKLINNKLLMAEFKDREEYELSETQINRQINEIIRRETNGDRAEFQLMLRKDGLSMQDFRKQVEENMIVKAMLDQEIRAPARRVREKEIREFYEHNRDEFVVPKEIRAKRIFISAEDLSSEGLAGRTEQIKNRLQRGENFRLVGLQVSDRPDQLNLTWIKVQELKHPVQEMAKKLPLEQVSPPVKTDDGVFFLRIEEKKGEKIQDLSEVRETIEKILIRRQHQESYEELMNKLRQKYQVKIYQ